MKFFSKHSANAVDRGLDAFFRVGDIRRQDADRAQKLKEYEQGQKRQKALDARDAVARARVLAAKGDIQGARAELAPFVDNLQDVSEPVPGQEPLAPQMQQQAPAMPMAQTQARTQFAGFGGDTTDSQDQPLADDKDFASESFGANIGENIVGNPMREAQAKIAAAEANQAPQNPEVAAFQAQKANDIQKAQTLRKFLRFKMPGSEQEITLDPQAMREGELRLADEATARKLALFDKAGFDPNNPAAQELRQMLAAGGDAVSGEASVGHLGRYRQQQADLAKEKEDRDFRVSDENRRDARDFEQQKHLAKLGVGLRPPAPPPPRSDWTFTGPDGETRRAASEEEAKNLREQAAALESARESAAKLRALNKQKGRLPNPELQAAIDVETTNLLEKKKVLYGALTKDDIARVKGQITTSLLRGEDAANAGLDGFIDGMVSTYKSALKAKSTVVGADDTHPTPRPSGKGGGKAAPAKPSPPSATIEKGGKRYAKRNGEWYEVK